MGIHRPFALFARGRRAGFGLCRDPRITSVGQGAI